MVTEWLIAICFFSNPQAVARLLASQQKRMARHFGREKESLWAVRDGFYSFRKSEHPDKRPCKQSSAFPNQKLKVRTLTVHSSASHWILRQPASGICISKTTRCSLRSSKMFDVCIRRSRFSSRRSRKTTSRVETVPVTSSAERPPRKSRAAKSWRTSWASTRCAMKRTRRSTSKTFVISVTSVS